jgi:PAS domain S-box-containing protein
MVRPRVESSTEPRAAARYGAALLVSALALLLTWLLGSLIASSPFLLFIAAVAISAWYGGLGSGLLATFFGVVAVEYFFIPPAFSLSRSSADILRLVGFTLVALLINWLIQARQRAVATAYQQERFRITLASIGDAVIATDAAGRITLMNPVAEALTGWTAAEASGQDLAAVFRIINEMTRQEVESPAMRVIREGVVVGLANHTLLIARDGAEIPIDDSGAPIHDATGNLQGVVLVFRDIAERRNAQLAQARLAAIVESSADAIISKSLDALILSWNAGAERIYGYTAEEAVGRPIAMLVPPDRPDELPQIMERLKRGEHIDHYETVRRRKDGRYIHVSLSISPIVSAAGVIVGASTIARDITERKQAEELLARYQLLSENARDIMLFIGLDGRIVEANRAAVEAYGYDHATLLSLNIYDLRDPVTAADVPSQIRQAHTTGILFETRHRRSDGATFPVEVNSFGADINGERLLLNIIRDITERKQAEEAQRFLAEASAMLVSELGYQGRLETLTHLVVPGLADWCAVDILAEDGSLELVAVAHVDPEKVAWAQDLRRRFPPDPQAPQGLHNVTRTGAPELYPEISDALLAAGARSPEELEIARQIGFSSAMVVPLIARGRTLGAITFVSAESGRRYSEADLALAEELARRAALAVDNARLTEAEQQARARAEAAVRLREQFLSVAAHELKTPLTSLLGYAQLFQRRTEREGILTERDQRALQVIVEQSARLNKMVLALLDLSRIETGQLTIERAPMDICALLRRLVEEIRPTLDGRALDLVCDDEPLMIAGDELRLEQVFQNLIQNAIKYSPDGQPVIVRARQCEQRACVSVADQGIGIPQTALPQLFQRFYRASNAADQQFSGIGVGLYVVKEIVDLHGGDVTVASVEGHGSTFTVSLPLLESGTSVSI